MKTEKTPSSDHNEQSKNEFDIWMVHASLETSIECWHEIIAWTIKHGDQLSGLVCGSAEEEKIDIESYENRVFHVCAERIILSETFIQWILNPFTSSIM